MRLVPTRASRIWPACPRVADTTMISAPSPAYRAKVPPAQNVSSSGWANTPSSRVRRAPLPESTVLPEFTLLPESTLT